MAVTTCHPFVHRHNPDGTVNSICSMCFETVAREGDEAALISAQTYHACKGIQRGKRLSSLDFQRPKLSQSRVRLKLQSQN